MNTAKLIANDKLNITEKIGNGNCNERENIYAAQCSKHKVFYSEHAGENFQSTSANIATTSKAGQTTMNL